MPAFVIARVSVRDADQYRKYAEASTDLAPKFGGRFIARGGKTVPLESDGVARRLVIIEFPNLAQAEAWYHSPEYQEVRKLRVGAADAEFVAVEGI